jgi:hypothetical protein
VRLPTNPVEQFSPMFALGNAAVRPAQAVCYAAVEHDRALCLGGAVETTAGRPHMKGGAP